MPRILLAVVSLGFAFGVEPLPPFRSSKADFYRGNPIKTGDTVVPGGVFKWLESGRVGMHGTVLGPSVGRKGWFDVAWSDGSQHSHRYDAEEQDIGVLRPTNISGMTLLSHVPRVEWTVSEAVPFAERVALSDSPIILQNTVVKSWKAMETWVSVRYATVLSALQRTPRSASLPTRDLSYSSRESLHIITYFCCLAWVLYL